MRQQWPRVVRLDAAGLVAAVNSRSDLRLRLLRPLEGGQVGAGLVALPSGDLAVLSSWPGALGARAPEVAALVARLREGGYPAPAYLAVINCEATTVVLQEYVDGRPPSKVDLPLVESMLELNARQRGALSEAGCSLADLHLHEDGPGYCLHAPLRSYDSSTAALLERVHRVARALPADIVAGTDVVHGDFHPGNVLVHQHRPHVVAGIVDWTGARAGNCGLDLVTLGFFLDHDAAAPRVRQAVRHRITADVDPGALLAFSAHMALRQVDWSIRHYDAATTSRWVHIADDWLTWAQRAH